MVNWVGQARTRRMGMTIAVALALAALVACGNTKAAGDDATTTNKDATADVSVTNDSNTDDTIADTVSSDVNLDGTPGDAMTDDSTGDGDATFDVNSSCPGGANCPCKVNGDCDNNVCLEVPDGHRCGIDCGGGGCPGAFSCALITVSGGDNQYICVPKWSRLCEPCDNSKLCSSALGNDKGVCIAYGGLEGSFCGSQCAADSECPTGYGCKDVVSVEGKSAKQCARLPDGEAHIQCPCDANATEQKLATTCNAAVVTGGSCPGTRACGSNGLSACTASPSATELCDGVDNDCNGLTDDVVCDDKNLCTDDLCVALDQTCAHTPNQLICSDGNACSTGDVCTSGVCTGKTIDCDDQNPCTSDSCDTKLGCQHENAAIPCDDGNACTLGDTCIDGSCVVGKKKDCNDQNACTADGCNSVSGACGHAPLTGNLCTDANFCTEGDTCTDGVCAGKVVDCDDKNACTTDSCAPTSGCDHATFDGVCEDGNFCTVGDTCIDSVCISGSSKNCNDQNACTGDSCDVTTGNCVNKPLNGAVCNDGNFCTLSDACTDTVCSGTLVNCDDQNPCTSDSCDPKSGCTHTSIVGACEDGSFCTLNDVCVNDVCVPGSAKNCDDNNACTADNCDAKTGSCIHNNLTSPCSDGNACTAGDTCAGGSCLGVTANCDDSNLCTDDSCDPKIGCLHAGNSKPCDDSNACTTGDVCVTFFSISGCAGNAINATVVCDDSNTCTTDTCTPSTGCTWTPKSGAICDDYNPCTQDDTCNANAVCVSGQNVCGCMSDGDCIQSGNLCTGALYCDKAAAPYYCKIDPKTVVKCDASQDGQCKSTACEPGSGKCVTSNLTDSKACDADSSVCTIADACQSGSCTPGTTLPCDDSNPCTTDACDPKNACTHSNNAGTCSDGNACTVNDTCAGGGCISGAQKTCNDGSTCTTDSCDTVGGDCVFDPTFWNGKDCDADGSVCTPGDKCAAGVCVAGAQLSCDDQNVCTNDACDPKNGCTHSNNAGSCNDGNACTVGDVCSAGGCIAGALTVCLDGSTCTTDSCDTTTGNCVFNAAPWNGTSCNADNSVCTPNDTCKAGVCVADTALACTDGNPCTDDSCDPAKGCVNVANTAGCADGDACTVGDGCVNSVCVPGAKKNCDDNNTCTTDSCDTATGLCNHPALKDGDGCQDGLQCTELDTCADGVCVGTPVSCDDSNPCTADSCSETAPFASRCVYTKASVGTPCNDGSLCTINDVCGTDGNSVFGCFGTLTPPGETPVDNPCTSDTCDKILGTVHTPIDQAQATGCSASKWCLAGVCKTQGCGDGFVANGEQCDDGNAAGCDGCESCQTRSAVVFGGGDSNGAYASASPFLAIDGDLTVEAWIKPLNFALNQPILSHAGSASKLFQTYMLMTDTAGKLVFQHWTATSGLYEQVKTPSALTANVWTHVAAVATGQTVRLYVNGVLAQTGTLTYKRQTTVGATFTIGRRWPDEIGSGFNGAIDEVHVAAAPLYGASFVPQRRISVGPATRGLWHLDEGTGTTAADASGTAQKPAYNLTLSGNTWLGDACYGGNAAAGMCGDGQVASATGSFPGTEECDTGGSMNACGQCQDCRYRRELSLGGSAAITTPTFASWAADAFCPTCSVTVEAWANATALDGVIFASTCPSGISSYLCNGFMLRTDSTDNSIVLNRANAGGQFQMGLKGGVGKVAPNSWHHYALEMGWANFSTTRVYLDGQLAITVLPSEWDTTPNPLPTIPATHLSEAMMLGAFPSDAVGNPVSLYDNAALIPSPASLSSAGQWLGTIDEMRVSAGLRYGANFVPPRRLYPDSQTRLLLHADGATTTLTDDSGKGVTTLNTSPTLADDCYLTSSSAAKCGDTVRAPWEWADGSDKIGYFPSSASAGLTCGVYWNADCTGMSWLETGTAPFLQNPVITYPTAAKSTGGSISSAWTWEGWVRIAAPPASGKTGTILSMDSSASAPGSGTTGGGGGGCTQATTQAWAIQTLSDGTDASVIGPGTSSAAKQVWKFGVWQHFALEYHGDGTGSLWVDGQKARDFLTVTATAWDGQCRVRIGAREAGPTQQINRIAGSMASLHMTTFVKYGAAFEPAWTLTADSGTADPLWDFTALKTTKCVFPGNTADYCVLPANSATNDNRNLDIGTSTVQDFTPLCTR